jgi:exopolyphosphatase/guanosine-5'-triphosphate,3'-diphosphate pyrophosphatase
MASVHAAADIGSNTAHLLVAATDGQLVMRIDNVNEWIPLGEEVARYGEIPRERVEDLVAAIREFKRVSVARAAKSLYVFATEAVRSAKNREAVLKVIKSETGVAVDVISPQREAELSMRGIRLDTRGVEANLMFEVGGGSAQIASLVNDRMTDEASLKIGTGRLIAECGLTSPCPADRVDAARVYLAHALSQCSIPAEAGVAIGCGGVARGLWRALHPDGEKELGLEEIDFMAWSAARLTVPRIIERFGVKTKRAGTMLAGALVYGALMRRFHCTQLHLSEFGVREGAILEMAGGKQMGDAL